MDRKVKMSSEEEVEVSVSEVNTGIAEDIVDDIIASTEELAANIETLAVSTGDESNIGNSSTDEPSDPRVQVLRKRIPPELNGLLLDADCLRFLRARNFSIEKATEMIEKWGAWWFTPLPGTDILPKDAASKPDENEDVYRELMPHSNLGETKIGCPLYWEKTGQISSVFYQVKKELTEDEIFVRHIRQQEVMVRRLKNASQRHQKLIEKQVIVMDMRNVVMTPDFMATRVFHRTVVIDEACYPERLHTLFMINAPYTFSILWALIKPWIDPVTVEKFKIIGSNYQEVLKEHIAEDQIPVEYGGTWQDFGWTFPHNISDDDRLKPPPQQEQEESAKPSEAATTTEESVSAEATESGELQATEVDPASATNEDPAVETAEAEGTEVQSVEISVSA